MTMSPKRNASCTKFVVPACGEHLESTCERTGHQFERLSKQTGRRMTNACKHRKGNPTVIAGRVGDFRVGEPLFYGRSLVSVVKNVGACSHRPDGVKDGGMSGKLCDSNWGDPPQFPPSGGITWRIRPGAESAVGCCGWESESAIVVRMCADNRTATERRAGRLSTRSAARGGLV